MTAIEQVQGYIDGYEEMLAGIEELGERIKALMEARERICQQLDSSAGQRS